jgi:hypothetical protein
MSLPHRIAGAGLTFRNNKVLLGWFSREQLSGEVVFPSLLLEYPWHELASDVWRALCLPCRSADF